MIPENECWVQVEVLRGLLTAQGWTSDTWFTRHPEQGFRDGKPGIMLPAHADWKFTASREGEHLTATWSAWDDLGTVSAHAHFEQAVHYVPGGGESVHTDFGTLMGHLWQLALLRQAPTLHKPVWVRVGRHDPWAELTVQVFTEDPGPCDPARADVYKATPDGAIAVRVTPQVR